MLDRLISGAGAVTDGADRSVRLLTRGSRRPMATPRPGSVAVAALLVVLAVLLVVAGLEATDPRTPRSLAPAAVATARDLGDRTYSTLSGSLHWWYVETFWDVNDNGVEDRDETAFAWYYWLVDPEDRTGVTVRSTRPPADVFTFQARGYVMMGDPHYLTSDRSDLEREVGQAGVSIDPDTFIDTSLGGPASAIPIDFAGAVPARGTSVVVAGSRLGSWAAICTEDWNRNHVCDADEEDQYEIVVFDPLTRHAVRVYVADLPEFTDATMSGLLRREERAVDDARTTEGFEFGELDLVVSDRYILEDGAEPGSAPLAFVLAVACVVIAAIILVGLAGGYLVYRKGDGRLPTAATTMAPGDRLPLRVSGLVRTPTGLEHVREAPGDLVRFVLGPVVTAPSDAADPSESVDRADSTVTTLLVERRGYPHGVALGLGELARLSVGRVMALRGPRPAARVVAGTGPLFLSFDTDAQRDRAVAELLDETGLGPDGRHIETP